MEITRETFLQQRHRRFGRENPERMDVPFWEMMVRCGKDAYWARKHFQTENEQGREAVWCFNRFGMSESRLSDARTLYIAGEHEDHYDPDFCIYNDLIVRHPCGRIEIFGYPRDVFPPTDFHSATLAGDRIILIGSVGYRDERQRGYTPVYALSLADFRITRLETSGESPGWLSKHEAGIDPSGGITIKGGRVMEVRDGKQLFKRNVEDFSLDLATRQWQRLTHRNWPEFSIRPQSGKLATWMLRPNLEALRAISIPHAVAPGAEWNKAVLLIDSVHVSLTLDSWELRIVIQGSLPHGVTDRLLDDIRSRAEELVGGQCALEQL